MNDLVVAGQKVLSKLRASKLSKLQVRRQDLQSTGLFDEVTEDECREILKLAQECIDSGNHELSRAMGSLVGMAVADGLGHEFEFLDVTEQNDPNHGNPFFCYDANGRGRFCNPLNQFRLRPGQWTDDASMGLCLADSMLMCGDYDGSNVRVWFWNWWNNGLDNAFRYDEQRKGIGSGSLSVGLGGNISKSLWDIGRRGQAGLPITPRFESDCADAGNGSLMRLAPVPVRFHHDLALARTMARESSFTTHPGPLAADACDLVAYLIVTALHRPASPAQTAREFLDRCREEYLAQVASGAIRVADEVVRLLRAEEPRGSTERCWNWRGASLGLAETLRSRGRSYNGYPVSAGYFGAFSLDGLAMALFAVYNTDSFDAALVKVINLAGDADSTGAICGQLAGAFYGLGALNAAWVRDMDVWSHGHVQLRAVLLYLEGLRDAAAAAAAAPTSTLSDAQAPESALPSGSEPTSEASSSSAAAASPVTAKPVEEAAAPVEGSSKVAASEDSAAAPEVKAGQAAAEGEDAAPVAMEAVAAGKTATMQEAAEGGQAAGKEEKAGKEGGALKEEVATEKTAVQEEAVVKEEAAATEKSSVVVVEEAPGKTAVKEEAAVQVAAVTEEEVKEAATDKSTEKEEAAVVKEEEAGKEVATEKAAAKEEQVNKEEAAANEKATVMAEEEAPRETAVKVEAAGQLAAVKEEEAVKEAATEKTTAKKEEVKVEQAAKEEAEEEASDKPAAGTEPPAEPAVSEAEGQALAATADSAAPAESAAGSAAAAAEGEAARPAAREASAGAGGGAGAHTKAGAAEGKVNNVCLVQ